MATLFVLRRWGPAPLQFEHLLAGGGADFNDAPAGREERHNPFDFNRSNRIDVIDGKHNGESGDQLAAWLKEFESAHGQTIKLVNASLATEKIDLHLNRLVPGGPRWRLHRHSQSDNVYIVRHG